MTNNIRYRFLHGRHSDHYPHWGDVAIFQLPKSLLIDHKYA